MKNVTNVQNENLQLLNELLQIGGIERVESKSISVSKNPKEKLLFSIKKEIGILNERNDLNLIVYKKGENSKIKKNGEYLPFKNDRIENRFYKNPIDNKVVFNLKYKGMIIPIGDGKSFSCDNNVEILINNLNHFYSVIENLNEDNSIFKLTQFESKSKK
jgi:hypothetical protein